MAGRYNNIRIDRWINRIELAIVDIEEEVKTSQLSNGGHNRERESNPSTNVITLNMTTVVREETTGLIKIFK